MQEEENENIDKTDECQETSNTPQDSTESVESKDANENQTALESQIAELEDRYKRAYADFENTKKRLIRDKDQALEYAYEKIAKDLLPNLDALENALKTIKDSKTKNENQDEILDKIEEGVSLILENLLKTLAKHGIEPIATERVFDPNFHDAILQVQSDEHESGEIVAEMQRGYKYKDRVLRPSMVSIAK